MNDFELNKINLNKQANLAAEFGHHYLAAGGPTSRIEMLLSDLGDKIGFRTEVFATSTGVFVTCSLPSQGQSVTVLRRITHTRTDMAELMRLEQLIEQFSLGIVSLEKVQEDVRVPQVQHLYYDRLRPICLFAIGLSTSLPHYGSWLAAMVSGFLTLIVAWVAGPLASRWKMSGVFSDFLGCFLALFLAAVCEYFSGFPRGAFVLGCLVYLAPGVSLTNAISELAEHNFVSGTAKMMRAVLTLLALGTAFLLMRDLSKGGFFNTHLITELAGPNIWQLEISHLFFSLLAVVAFSILFHVPFRLLPMAMFTGLVSLWILHFFQQSNYYVVGSFMPALSVGLLSLFFSRLFKVPSQIFSVPGIFALVPGMLALSSFYEGAPVAGSHQDLDVGWRVAIVASSIVFGLFTARIPFTAFRPSRPVHF